MSQSLPLSDLTLVKYSHTQFSHTSQTMAIVLRTLLLRIKKETKQTQIIISVIFFILAPCILTTLMFLSPTNALLYYTYKMLK